MPEYTKQHARAGIDNPLPKIKCFENQFKNYEITISIPEGQRQFQQRKPHDVQLRDRNSRPPRGLVLDALRDEGPDVHVRLLGKNELKHNFEMTLGAAAYF